MKKVVLSAVVAMGLLTSCLKQNNKCTYVDSNAVAPTQEIADLRDSLELHGIHNAVLSPSGFYYEIVSQGSGRSVTNLCSMILVHYKGTLFNGTTFDSTATDKPAYFPLGNVIVGWQKGIPLINKGGEINLYIPPALAYGDRDMVDPSTGNVVLPKHSFLIFNVKVLDIQ